MLEVIGVRTAHGQEPRGRAARLRHGNKPLAAEILAGNRFRTGDNIVHRAAGHEMAAVRARSGADVDQKIRRAHRVLVVLDDDQRIAQIAQVFQRLQKPVVVALMQADGRLVENIQHAHQRRADLRRQPDALRLAARKRRRGAGERQVSQSHVAQEVKPRPDLLENLLRDHFLPGRQLQLIEEIAQLHHRQIAQIGNRQPADRYRQHLGAQPLAVALRAGRVHHLRLVDLAHRVGVRLRILALQVRNDAFKRRFKFHHAGAGRIFDRDLFAVGAVKDHIQRLFRQFAHGRIDRKAVMFCKRLEIDGAAARIAMRIPAAGHNRALRERKRLIRNHRVRVDRAQKAQTRTRRARAERAVEREHARRHLFDADAAVRAGVIGREDHLALLRRVDDRQPVPLAQRRFQRIRQPRFNVFAHRQPVDYDLDGMLLLLGKRGQLVRLIHFAVDAHAHIALLLQPLEQLRVFALARPHERRHDLQPRPFRQREQLIDHLVDRLLANLPAAFRAVRNARARVEQTQVVVNFRHRADGRTRIARRRLLVDGNGRGKAVDAVQIRFVHLAEKLPRVG